MPETEFEKKRWEAQENLPFAKFMVNVFLCLWGFGLAFICSFLAQDLNGGPVWSSVAHWVLLGTLFGNVAIYLPVLPVRLLGYLINGVFHLGALVAAFVFFPVYMPSYNRYGMSAGGVVLVLLAFNPVYFAMRYELLLAANPGQDGRGVRR